MFEAHDLANERLRTAHWGSKALIQPRPLVTDWPERQRERLDRNPFYDIYPTIRPCGCPADSFAHQSDCRYLHVAMVTDVTDDEGWNRNKG